ncbi:hypothetical protein D3C76_1502600 [compost metagenome]
MQDIAQRQIASTQLAVTPGQQTFGIDILDLAQTAAADAQPLARSKNALFAESAADLHFALEQDHFIAVTTMADRETCAKHLNPGVIDFDHKGAAIMDHVEEHLPLNQTHLA